MIATITALAVLTTHMAAAQTVEEIRAGAVPVTREPLHSVRYDVPPFLIYTNYIMPGVWTQFHQHRTDLLAVIAADTETLGQTAGEEVKARAVPGGTTILFPYADLSAPYVHRVGVTGHQVFVNVGLEFHDPVGTQCADVGAWDYPAPEAVTPNRRGTAYRISLAAGATVNLPTQGRGLLLVPLAPITGESQLQLDGVQWLPALGDFRFYSTTPGMTNGTTNPRPGRLQNSGKDPLRLVVFSAC